MNKHAVVWTRLPGTDQVRSNTVARYDRQDQWLVMWDEYDPTEGNRPDHIIPRERVIDIQPIPESEYDRRKDQEEAIAGP